MISFCSFYVYQKEIAEEIVSDVFVHLWVNRANLSHVVNPETYLFVSVKNRAINHCKSAAKLKLVNIDDCGDELAFTYQPDKDFEKKELMFQLDKAIETLPLQCKVIFKMVKENGMKCKEVAEILEISPRTVETQVYRAMNKISTIMVGHQNQREGRKVTPIRHIASVVIAWLSICLEIFV